jgi:hypothetical protein
MPEAKKIRFQGLLQPLRHGLVFLGVSGLGIKLLKKRKDILRGGA